MDELRKPEYIDEPKDKSKTKRTERKILQIMPAPAGTYALYLFDDNEKEYSRVPIPAFGVWEEFDVLIDKSGKLETSRVRSFAGPLVFEHSFLVPVCDDHQFKGIRYGSYVDAGDTMAWDSPEQEREAFKPPSK
jgi:hypothetical protein